MVILMNNRRLLFLGGRRVVWLAASARRAARVTYSDLSKIATQFGASSESKRREGKGREMSFLLVRLLRRRNLMSNLQVERIKRLATCFHFVLRAPCRCRLASLGRLYLCAYHFGAGGRPIGQLPAVRVAQRRHTQTGEPSSAAKQLE